MKRVFRWHTFETAQFREIQGIFRHNPWDWKRIYTLLGVKRGMKIADVGCGGGLFSRKIADRVGTKGMVVGFDNDNKLIEEGNTISYEQRYHNVRLKVGDVYRLSVKAGTFDLVTCHLLLYLLDAKRALKEMIRICKKGGRISVMEPLFLRYNSAPLRQLKKEKSLEERFYQAKTKYFEKMKRKNKDYQNKVASLPFLFAELGLKDVRVDGETVVFWPADHRHKKEFIVNGYKTQLDFVEVEIENARPLVAGRFSEEELDQLKRYRKSRLKRLMKMYTNKSHVCEFLLTVELIVSGTKP